MTTVMWEAKAAPGRVDDLLAHALRNAHAAAQIYRSPDGRVVVIDPTGTGLRDVDDALLARPPHAWHFEPVPRDDSNTQGCST